jgi:hypothetical protein
MALSANSKVEGRVLTYPKQQVQVVNAATIYSGAHVALCGIDHATTANRGRVKPFAALASEIPFGWHVFQEVLGNTSPGTGVPIPEGEVFLGARLYQGVTVTGVAGNQTDVGQEVFLSDDNTWTLTRPALGVPMGIIVRSVSATTCDVYMFSWETIMALMLGGAAKYTWHLGSVTPTGGTGNALTGIVAPHHGKIVDFYGIVACDATDADVDISLNLEIGGVNVTGGVITWLFSDVYGVKKSGTAITALNVMHEGDLIDVEAVYNAAGTATDPGLLNLYATVQIVPGL